jgi:hypothetical protein
MTVAAPLPVHEGEFWTAKQRQAHSLHEISYRACFKPQLPGFFIDKFTRPGGAVYDPFLGRGTTALEAAFRGRVPLGNDLNPLSVLLTRPRLDPPSLEEVRERLDALRLDRSTPSDRDLSMFYHRDTLGELASLRRELFRRSSSGEEDRVDRWIRMVATNRLTGHSPGFFSVYTLPPNQAASPESQIKINARLRQRPEYKDVKAILWRKTRQLLRDLLEDERRSLAWAGSRARLSTGPADRTPDIGDDTVDLVVTSPPFLDIVDYAGDNWLRHWFNGVGGAPALTVLKSLEAWSLSMGAVFRELFRVVRPGGRVAFEVGEVRKGSVRLEEAVTPIGQAAGFSAEAVYINAQKFTKTAHIWGVSNNAGGTNTNRIVLFQKI